MKKMLLLLSMIINQMTFVMGQDKKIFEGEYEFNGKSGTASFEYVENKSGDISLHGKFNFDRKYIDSLDKTKLSKLRVRGAYDNNRKVGKWLYDQEQHQVFLHDVENFKVNASLESEDVELTAVYEAGLPHGEWKYKENIFSRGRLESKFVSEPFQFRNGVIVGEVHFREFDELNTYSIKGRLTSNGVMEGNWVFVYNEGDTVIEETRRYENGFLIGLVKVNQETKETIEEVIYYDTIEKLDNLGQQDHDFDYEISDRLFGLTFNDGYREDTREFLGQFRGVDFLERVMVKLLGYERTYVSEAGELVQYPVHTRRFEYPITKDDEQRAEEIGQVYEELTGKVNDMVELNALELNRFRDDSLAYAFSFFGRIHEKLKNFDNVVEIVTSDELRYFDQSNYVRDGLTFLTAYDTISYEFDGKQVEKLLDFSDVTDQEDSRLTADLLAYIQKTKQMVDKVSSYVDGELLAIEQAEDLAVLEATVLRRKANVDSLYLSYEAQSDDELQMMASIYENILEKQFNQLSLDYSRKESYVEKFRAAKILVDLLKEMEAVFEPLQRIYPSAENLRDRYTETTLDPFTFNPNFKVIRKRRLFEAAMLVFEDHVEQLSNEQEYTEIANHIDAVMELMKRMAVLREDNTSRLERRVGRTTDVDQIKRLLDL